MKRFLNFKNLIILFLIILGLFLRFYKLSERTVFDADQEWLSYRANDLLKGDVVLIGPVTSVGNFSIGPGFIYLLGLVSFFMDGNPISAAILSVVLGILALIAIYYFVNQFIDKKTSLLILYLLSISFSLIVWDQNPWAPSLFYLSQTILLIGAYLSLKKDIGYIIMAIAVVIGFQSHIGIVLSLASLSIYFVFVKPIKPKISTIIYSILILFFGFIPNIIFDLTHNFVNFKRFIGIIHGDGIDYFLGFGKIINVLSDNVVSIFYPRRINIFDNIFIKVAFAIILVNSLSYLRSKKFKNLSLLLLVTTIFPALFFYIQQGKFSEYYLMMTVPSLIIMLSLFIYSLFDKKIVLILFILMASYLNVRNILIYKRNLNLKAKMSVAQDIVNKAGYDNYGISLSVRHGDQFGFKFIFDYYGIKADIPPQKGETKIFSIIIPEGYQGMNGMKDFDGIGLRWQGI